MSGIPMHFTRELNPRYLIGEQGVRRGYVLAPSLLNSCMDWELVEFTDQCSCGASVGDIRVTDRVFADVAVLLPKLLVLVLALEVLEISAMNVT